MGEMLNHILGWILNKRNHRQNALIWSVHNKLMVDNDTVSAAVGAAGVVLLGVVYLLRTRGTYSKLKKSKTFSPANLADCYLPNHANKMEWPGRRIYLHSGKEGDEVCNGKITSLKEKLARADGEEQEILEIYNPCSPNQRGQHDFFGQIYRSKKKGPFSHRKWSHL